MDQLGLDNPVYKFYSVNKFKYLPIPEEGLDKSKKHNKMSYCKTC